MKRGKHGRCNASLSFFCDLNKSLLEGCKLHQIRNIFLYVHLLRAEEIWSVFIWTWDDLFFAWPCGTEESATSADSQAAYFGAPSIKLKTNSSLLIYLCQLVYLIRVFREQIHFILTLKQECSVSFIFSPLSNFPCAAVILCEKLMHGFIKLHCCYLTEYTRLVLGLILFFFLTFVYFFHQDSFHLTAHLHCYSLAPPSLYRLMCNICVCCLRFSLQT